MKKSLSFAAITIVVLCSFSASNLKVEVMKLAEIPPVIIGIPPMHLSVIYSKQEKIRTDSSDLNDIRAI